MHTTQRMKALSIPPQTVRSVIPIRRGNICDAMIQTFSFHIIGTQERFLLRKYERFLGGMLVVVKWITSHHPSRVAMPGAGIPYQLRYTFHGVSYI